MSRFRVFVDDNFHFMDADERYLAGEFETLEEALVKCRSMIDDDLRRFYKPGMTARELLEMWSSFGEDPWIPGGDFSAVNYARQRCGVICQ